MEPFCFHYKYEICQIMTPQTEIARVERQMLLIFLKDVLQDYMNESRIVVIYNDGKSESNQEQPSKSYSFSTITPLAGSNDFLRLLTFGAEDSLFRFFCWHRLQENKGGGTVLSGKTVGIIPALLRDALKETAKGECTGWFVPSVDKTGGSACKRISIEMKSDNDKI